MRIAQVSPLYESVPPMLYGGTERVVSFLTEELVRLGHDVTLFASGDSRITAELVPACSRSLRLDPECVDPGGGLPCRVGARGHRRRRHRLHRRERGPGGRRGAPDRRDRSRAVPARLRDAVLVGPHGPRLPCIAAGLARYGLKSEASVVLTALFDATLALELSRLPDLFCGFPRRPGEGPTNCPVACAPQAWAAAVPFLLLQSVLGADVDAVGGKVAFDHPVLPACLAGLTLSELRVGDATIDLRIERYPADVGIEVNRRLGRVSVVLVK